MQGGLQLGMLLLLQSLGTAAKRLFWWFGSVLDDPTNFLATECGLRLDHFLDPLNFYRSPLDDDERSFEQELEEA